tara:strand:- start:711 stop:1196 length:486 start_codon:yes stop_codon:yes gene_type:complete
MLDKIQTLFDRLDRKQLILLAIVSIVVICVLGYYLYTCINPVHEDFEEEVDESMDNIENFSNNPAIMRMFHVNWCGYCKSAKPHFIEFQKQVNGTKINGRDVVVELVDFEDSANEEIVKEFENEVEGYPTIILTKDGENHHYKGDRESASSYLTYLKEMLA